jgi:hypothetical protein
MKTTMSFLLLLMLAGTCFSQAKVGIRILQNGAPVAPTGGNIELKKAPFTIEMTMEGAEGVYCYADFTGNMYKLGDKESIPELQDIPYKVVKEHPYNANKELTISNDSWSYWFHSKNEPEHKFDKDIKIVNDQSFVATKTVEQFFFPESLKRVKLTDATESLYLFFLVTNPYQKGSTVRELSRQKLRIIFK